MSTDPATFVAGVPVKISEKYRPPRKISLPASCQHQINSELLTQDYDFAVEKTTIQWVQERRNRIEKEERKRQERIAKYEQKKAEIKAKEEEEERLRKEKEEIIKQEKENERLKKEEEEKSRLEEEEDIRRLEEEVNQEEQTQETEKTNKDDAEEVTATTNASQMGEINGNDSIATSGINQISPEVASHEAPQAFSASTSEETSYCSSGVINNASIACRTETTNVSNNASSYGLMLQPTPFPSNKSVRSPSKTPANINFADFEGEGNDPFDSAALKSINDMEELAKVLDSSHITQKPVEGTNSAQAPTKESQTYHNVYPNGQLTYGAFGQYPYFMPPQQQHLQQSLQQQNMTQQRPGFPQYGNHLAKNPQVTQTSSTPSSSDPQYAKDPARTFQNKYYPQPWGSGYNVNSPSKTAQFVPYDYCLQAANLANSISNTTQGVMSPSNNTGNASTLPTYTSGGGSTVQSVDRGSTVSKRQDLEDFYSKYYLHNKCHVQQNQQSGIQSGESTPSHSSSSGAAGSTTGSLRSCRSVPDLTAAEDSEVTKYSSGLQSQNESRGVSHTPPPRPSSTGLTGLEDWKPLPDISGLSEISSNQHLYQSSPVQHPAISSLHTPIKSRLPDPFGELTTDAQALVQNMAEMGFPRPRVARAVQKLGTDHKKLIEVLLELQSLQGNGEDGYKAERAFYHYMGDIQKTKDHLAAAKQLLDLGFEEEQIVDALLKHDNDRDKALEELIA
ncbi:stress response protein NST1-like [Portunus trituberculatus]|uniref:stress response protein NST1-like n=1 Tax=Portunus trituberculatus TaxID=210409 RepID=UPI001E1D1D74|nr:stress response protein NST1-like [Portunus trituberculatus]XP_045135743.1 stress response protein NST1-like [Portunus trituberculatus]XP_045135744.1 stress response protein NST1-like [Portunus trituberculatus]XP_045135745.1 stress response protein NST1-like [Portunus trituberculatus]